jgi:hypothetical protein
MWVNTAGDGKKFPRTPTTGTVRRTMREAKSRAIERGVPRHAP